MPGLVPRNIACGQRRLATPAESDGNRDAPPAPPGPTASGKHVAKTLNTESCTSSESSCGKISSLSVDSLVAAEKKARASRDISSSPRHRAIRAFWSCTLDASSPEPPSAPADLALSSLSSSFGVCASAILSRGAAARASPVAIAGAVQTLTGCNSFRFSTSRRATIRPLVYTGRTSATSRSERACNSPNARVLPQRPRGPTRSPVQQDEAT